MLELKCSKYDKLKCICLDSLQACAGDITTMVNVNQILPKMLEQKLITSNQHQELTNVMHTTATKQEKLCSIILGLSEDCVNKFLHCLLETSYEYKPHKELYDKLYEFIHSAE